MSLVPTRPQGPLAIGISQCLLGEEVRYDGTGARSSLPHTKLDGLFEFSGICPEVGIGMTIPRKPIRLVSSDDIVRVVGVNDSSIDKTDDLQDYAIAQKDKIAKFSGYIFMHNSPSCGLFRVKVYAPRADVPGSRTGTGIFAQQVIEDFPNLPVEEAGRLFDDEIRENFVTRVFTYAHWQSLPTPLTAAHLVEFHSRYKYLLMAHSISAYKQTGRLLSNLSGNVEEIASQYIILLMNGLGKPATRNGHANVLAHLQGYLKKRIDSESKQELDKLIQSYRRGEQPLLAPLALLRHHLQKFPDEYVLQQSYLDPHPEAAGLRRPL